MFKATNDELIHAALAGQVVELDPETGLVTIDSHFEAYPDGYLWVAYRGRRLSCHRIMWLAHHPSTPSDLQVNHVNGRRWDNRLINLELVTPSDNVRHGWGAGYVAVSDSGDDHCVPSAWMDEVYALAQKDDVTSEEIAALKSPAQPRQRALFCSSSAFAGRII